MSDKYYAKCLLRYLRTTKIGKEADNYEMGLKTEFARAAFWVTKWEAVSEEIELEWKDLDHQLNVIHIRAKEILEGNKGPKFAKSEEQQTRACVAAVMQTIYDELHYSVELSDDEKSNWNKLVKAYYITEVGSDHYTNN